MATYRPFGEREYAERDAWLERLAQFLNQGMGTAKSYKPPNVPRQLLNDLDSFCYESDERALAPLRPAGLFALGEALCQEWGATWQVREDGDQVDYVLAHPGFPEPVILRLLHEYCDTTEYEHFKQDGEPRDLMPDGKEIWFAATLEWAMDALVARIRIHNRDGVRIAGDKPDWRRDVPFSVGVTHFPPHESEPRSAGSG
jgi:hypothetical protein